MKKGGSFLLDPVLGTVFTRERFSEEQKEIESMVRDFARERIYPRREELTTHNKDLSLELMREVAELGMTGIDLPERFGGLELGKTTAALVNEALTRGESGDWIVTFSVHVGIGSLPLVFFGSDEQREKYLPKIASAEWLAAYALTEPGSGSDAMSLQTSATPTEDGEAFILKGAKQYITNGGWADLFTIFARIPGKGITAFLVERDTEGLIIGPEEKKMGMKGSSTVNLTLEDMRVPKENLLGKPGEGGNIALNILNIGRFKLGAADLGACKFCVDAAVQYAQERRQFGQPVAWFQAMRKKFADMLVRTYMLDSVIYRTVGLMDERIASLDTVDPGYNEKVMAALEEYAIEASISKILGSESLFRISDHGIQIFGGYGYSEEYPMARVYRNSRIDRIWEGTNEINRMVIYGYYLKKALMEELPLRDAEKGWDADGPSGADGSLAQEVEAIDVSRRLTVKCLFEAISRYGQDLRHQQVIGEDLADLVIGYFAASSAINRILQLGDETRRDRTYRALGRLVTATYLEDAWRLFYRLRPMLHSDNYAQRLVDNLEERLRKLHLPFDPVKELEVLTDDLFHHGRYRFE
jgi:alkylation response protein AidB-like acyl-CoA dehydrogenase